MPPDPPEPLYSEVVAPGAIYRVWFNKPLQGGGLVAANWKITHNLLDHNPYSVSASGYRVSLASNPDVTFSPPNGISYDAAPPDLIGANGYPVAAFPKIPFV